MAGSGYLCGKGSPGVEEAIMVIIRRAWTSIYRPITIGAG